MFSLIREGWSFSGRERDQCFLNLQTLPFATCSAVSGLDLIDDGRAAAVVDWDHDGRLDLWVSARTSPAVRFLHNQSPRCGHYLSLHLIGRKCNRDAIGARVELYFGGDQPTRRIKTLHAGDAFLSQSSKWLHFGLGKNERIERIVVTWPNHQKQEFHVSEVDRSYVIEEGAAEPKLWDRPGKVLIPPQPAAEAGPAESSTARIVFYPRQELPRLRYQTRSGAEADASVASKRSLLINIWNLECLPCRHELRELTLQAAELKAKGVDVIALHADKGEPGTESAWPQAAVFLDKMSFPFEPGKATEPLLELLDTVQQQVLHRYRGRVVPTSFLLDDAGRLAVLYHGELDVHQLLADRALLQSGDASCQERCLPFRGRWYNSPFSRPEN